MMTPEAHVPIEILLVEDNPGDVRLTREALRDGKVGNRLHVAMDGVDAMAFLRKEGAHADAPSADIVLLDLNLPRKSGREVLDEIKRDPNLKHIPVVILTSSQAEQDVLSSYRLSANAYVHKTSRSRAVSQGCSIDRTLLGRDREVVADMIAPAPVKPIHLLIVEDNAGDARLIIEMLRYVKGAAFESESAGDLKSTRCAPRRRRNRRRASRPRPSRQSGTRQLRAHQGKCSRRSGCRAFRTRRRARCTRRGPRRGAGLSRQRAYRWRYTRARHSLRN